MSLQRILEEFERAPVQPLLERMPSRGAELRIGGLPGSSDAVLVSWLATRLPERLIVVITSSPAAADRWVSDLQALTDVSVALYPQREGLGEDEPHYEIAGERVETIEALLRGRLKVLVTPARATAERTPIPAVLAESTLQLRPGSGGETATLSRVGEALDRMGYHRVPAVSEVAHYSIRGGILDIYGFGMASPARCEWWGDDLISLRGFDLTTQRSLGELDDITVLPIAARVETLDAAAGTSRQSLFELLPPDTVVVADGAEDYPAEVTRAWNDAEHHIEVARRLGEAVPPRAELFLEPDVWRERHVALPRLVLAPAEAPADLQMGFLPPERIDRNLNRLRSLLGGDPPTIILCDNEGQLERLEDLLEVRGRLPPATTLAIGALDGGFVMPSLRVLTDHEIFRRARRLRRARRYREAAPSAVTGVLSAGDYVVHLEHGIGVYRGIDAIPVDGTPLDVAVVEYQGGDRLNVPLYQLDQLEPYRAGDGDDRAPPKIHKLGGASWKRTRQRTREAIRQMAAQLLDLYARRAVAPGFAFPLDTRWQRELESSFLYEDTPDQRQASEEVKADMEQPVPMDRLLVGDVGYGKTEVGVRAAFKAVQASKQVAMLVPTTILAEQHGRTFTERLADFPVRVEVLSRFRTPKEQRDVLRRLDSGEVDIVIGTHRLLSKDVTLNDLGLLIVDEEHRFGVRHKEQLKAMRLSVDVLTLTATPIPRTLHLSLAGLRDISMIETPPRDRSPILTFVEPWDDGLLEEAIARELDRGGQVFVVHNRIETIHTIAARIQSLAPRAEVAVAHGRLPAETLDGVMRRFVTGKVDILVSTMIVESGLDVPNSNTMIVHDAHRLGLAQLYQLRGRVGRSHRRAYCYLLVPDVIDPDAEDRLKFLEHHTDLGSGYRIALKDLELRGAGNLLGGEQSGHAHAVGFDLYMRWLEETVRALKGQGVEELGVAPETAIDAPAHLPDSYVPDDDAKLDVYRRIARARDPEMIDDLQAELRERFGPLAVEALALLEVARIRVIGASLGLQHVLVRGDEARLTFRAGTTPRLAGLTAALDDVQLAADVRRTVPLSLRLHRLGGEPLVPTLVRALRAVQREGRAAQAGTSP
ncbi:MAG: transcription-repair coupling factor [Gemmatimonadales bacterium]|nr:transcription-repair coupling factor [Gemmatimonadales bacterium]